jgi:CBS domain-containing protein
MLVRDCMNRDLVYARDGDHPSVVIAPMRRFGLHAVPVLDEDHRPVGMITLAQFVGEGGQKTEATTISQDASVDAAARAMGEADVDHLVAVDEGGIAVGVLAALDVVRALAGMPARHPPSTKTFP